MKKTTIGGESHENLSNFKITKPVMSNEGIKTDLQSPISSKNNGSIKSQKVSSPNRLASQKESIASN